MSSEIIDRLQKSLNEPSSKVVTVSLDGDALQAVTKYRGNRSAKETASDLILLGATRFEELNQE